MQACLESVDESETKAGSFTAFDATLIVDNEDNEPILSTSNADAEPIVTVHRSSPNRDDDNGPAEEDEGCASDTGHHLTSYDRYKNVATIQNIEDDAFDGKLKPTGEILLWHYRLGHVPFSRL